jgi:crossover junction endodeoxyribonuclease RusA
MIQQAMKGLMSRLEVCIDAYPPDARVRDLDNLLKPALDSMQDYGMFNDGQIDILRIRRMEKGGYVRVYISEIPL